MLTLDIFRRKDVAPFEMILIYRNEGDLSNDYRATGVPMFRIKPTGLKVGYIPRLRRLLRREKVDILHAQTLRNGLLSILCTCFSRVKLVTSFHGFLSTVKHKIYAHLVMWSADASVFVSNYEREWFIKHIFLSPGKRCHVVYNGIDLSKLNKEYPVPDFLDESRRFPEVIRLAMVGNFVRGRSPYFICQALKALKDKGVNNILFYFIGKRSLTEPERFDDCVRYCRENGLLDTSVFFTGGRDDIPSVLQHIDGFVYSSDCDTFGIAVVEAMAAGIPVVVNDWIVMKEITDNGNLATIYKTLDVDDCATKIEDLTIHIDERKEKARMVADVVRQRYSIENHIQNLFEVYKSTLV